MPLGFWGNTTDFSRKGFERGLQIPDFTTTLLWDAFQRLGQNTYMTPEQSARLIQQLTSPGIANLQEGYGQQSRALTSNFANRGQLFGGSLFGAQAQLGTGYNRALSDLMSNVGGQVGQLDLQLGSQRQLQSQQLIANFINQLLQGNFGIMGAKTGKPGAGQILAGLAGTAAGAIL